MTGPTATQVMEVQSALMGAARKLANMPEMRSELENFLMFWGTGIMAYEPSKEVCDMVRHIVHGMVASGNALSSD
jgi:hypothetical protein